MMDPVVIFSIALAVILLLALLVGRVVVLKVMRDARDRGERPLGERRLSREAGGQAPTVRPR